MKSNLKIFKNGAEIPLPKGARYAIDMSLDPIAEAAEVVRAVDGSAVSLGMDGFRLYDVSISCSDHNIAPIAGIWPGDTLTIHASVELTDPGPAVMLSREPVPGSVRAHSADGTVIATPEGRTVNVPGASYFSYRPILNVMVTGKSARSTEWKASSAWSISATELEPSQEAGGVVETWDQVEATGGEVSEYTDELNRSWRVHRFTSTSALAVAAAGWVEYIAVGGGGGGGNWNASGGGGGAGGVTNLGMPSAIWFDAGTYTVEIGAGGAGGAGTSSSGLRGSDTRVGYRIRAYGGGGGGAYGQEDVGQRNGGSGGGNGHRRYSTSYPTPGTGMEGQGHDGGISRTYNGAPYLAGGGGGAGGPGYAYNHAEFPSHGGPGVMTTIAGFEEWLGGGGAGGDNVVDAALGGVGGGGGGGNNPGTPNTGGGGARTQDGGSGIFIMRYRIG